MKNKKGISAIVATVLIILITVAAVTIIWAAIIPMIRDQLGGAAECFDASASLTVLSEYSCYNSTAIGAADKGIVKIQVSRSSGDFELVGLDISGMYQGTSDTYKVDVSNIPDANGAKVYTINVNSTGTADTQFTLGGVDAASVAARVRSGQADKVCPGSSVTQITTCA